MKIIIHSCDKMRYDTLGDWFQTEEGTVMIQVDSKLSEDAQFLVALHELVEWKLCQKRGITQEQVDEFDFSFEPLNDNDEPGDHPDSPYRREHRFAMMIEHLMAHELGIENYGEVK